MGGPYKSAPKAKHGFTLQMPGGIYAAPTNAGRTSAAPTPDTAVRRWSPKGPPYEDGFTTRTIAGFNTTSPMR